MFMNYYQLVSNKFAGCVVLSGIILVITTIGLKSKWIVEDGRSVRKVCTGTEREARAALSMRRVAKDVEAGISEIGETSLNSSHRRPHQDREEGVEPAAVLAVLANGKQTVEERVQQVQTMRGIVLSKEERDSIMAFFAGKQIPAGMGKGSMQWLADELMTVLRLQQPPQEGLAAELGKVAFQPGTDPVVRDYLMQHLGHLWEQFGAREEIEKSLWLAVASSDETTPGSALIALSRGYQRDQQEKSLEKVRQQALALAQNPTTGLAVRVTALSIAGEGQGAAVKELANGLITDPATPLILRKVAERVVAP